MLKTAKYFNLMLTFLVSVLRHGARWNYVIWGGRNGYTESVSNGAVFGGSVDTKSITEVKELPEKCYEYLIRTIELAASKEIPLLLVVNPYMGIMYEEKKLYNRVAQIVQMYGIDYIDFNDYYKEIGI